MIQAVIFDMGGTLIEFKPDHLPWLEWERAGLQNAYAYLSARGHAISEQALIARFIDGLPARWRRATQGKGNLRLGDVMRDTCAAFGIALTEGEIDELIAHYVAPLDARIAPFDDTLRTLEALRARGFVMGIVSNTMWPGEYHRRELDRLGLTPFFRHVVFSADVGVWKPQPGIYALSLDALGVSAAEAVFVGDMPEHDIVGAQNVGMRGIYVQNSAFLPEDVHPDATITHLAELPDLLDRWRNGGPCP